MIDPQPGPVSFDEYDSLVPPEGEFYELENGYIVSFATGTGAHGIICTRIATALDTHVKAPCRVFGASSIGVRIADRTTSLIPDGLVTCEEFAPDATYVTEPKLVVEVISPSSLTRDRIQKLDAYRSIPSLEEYLMVDARRVWACVFRRAPGSGWIDVTYSGLDDRVDLLSIDLRIALADLYRGIDVGKSTA
jgi:Uma2 family endonuclease